MITAIKGNGSTPITGVDFRVSHHTSLLDDGSGNLAAIYDIGDHIHENNAGRQIIARVWRDSLAELELLEIVAPSAPIIGTAVSGESSAAITFAPPQFNGGSATIVYAVTSSPGSFTNIGNVSPITVEGLQGGISYTFTVTATNAAGESVSSSASNSVTVLDTQAPVLSSGSSSAKLSADTAQATMTLLTNERSTCKYSTAPNTVYDDMENIFSTTGQTSHSTVISGLTNGFSYNYYVRCQDEMGNQNQNDYEINFRVLASSDSISMPDINTNQEEQKLDPSKKLYLDKKNFKLKGGVSELSGGEIKIYADNKKIEEVDIGTDGSWSKKLKLKNESYNLKLKYYDSEGNKIDSQTYRLEVDNENPSFSSVDTVHTKTNTISFPAQDQETDIKYYKVKLLDDQGHILRKWKKQNQPNIFCSEGGSRPGSHLDCTRL